MTLSFSSKGFSLQSYFDPSLWISKVHYLRLNVYKNTFFLIKSINTTIANDKIPKVQS